MAELPNEIIGIVLDLQRRLLAIINRATATGFSIVEQYGETEETVTALQDMQNAQERANTYYSRFYTLLLRIAEAQPTIPTAMLNLLDRSITEAQATTDALEATIQEERRNFYVVMTQQRQQPDLEKVKQTSTKIQEICKRCDANIVVLDDIIAQLEADARSLPMYCHRLNKAKQLLDFEREKSNLDRN